MLKYFAFVCTILLLALPAPRALAEDPALKSAYPDFLIGAAIGPLKSYSPAEMSLLTTQFNAVTPENCMKPSQVHPAENTWNFKEPDALVAFAQEHHMTVFGHTLVWHEQTPKWFFMDSATGKPASREVALAHLKDHITTLVSRYKGKIRAWDVVNEAISDKPGEYLRPCPWLTALGDGYIEEAFACAHAADPGAELQYNDYNIEQPAKRKKVLQLIASLQAKKIPITSVGIQCHFALDHVPFQELDDSINAFRAAGVKVAITELDMDVIPAPKGADAPAVKAATLEAQQPKPCPPEILHRQAEQYAKLFALFRKHRADLIRVTFWGLDDGHSWLNFVPVKRYNHPLLFDRDATPKPAFQAVIDAAK